MSNNITEIELGTLIPSPINDQPSTSLTSPKPPTSAASAASVASAASPADHFAASSSAREPATLDKQPPVCGEKRVRRRRDPHADVPIAERRCENCGTESTGQWRYGSAKRSYVCSACEKYSRQKKMPRPPALWKPRPGAPMPECSNCKVKDTARWCVGSHPNERLCAACARHLSKYGSHRPEHAVSQICDNCRTRVEKLISSAKKGSVLCRACANYWKTKGRDRPRKLFERTLKPSAPATVNAAAAAATIAASTTADANTNTNVDANANANANVDANVNANATGGVNGSAGATANSNMVADGNGIISSGNALPSVLFGSNNATGVVQPSNRPVPLPFHANTGTALSFPAQRPILDAIPAIDYRSMPDQPVPGPSALSIISFRASQRPPRPERNPSSLFGTPGDPILAILRDL